MEKFIYVLYALCISITVVSGTFFALHFIIFMKMMSVVISAGPPASILITISTDFLMEVANSRNHSTFTRSRISFRRLPFSSTFPAIISNIIIHRFFIALSFGRVCAYLFSFRTQLFSALALCVRCQTRLLFGQLKWSDRTWRSQNWHFNVFIFEISYDILIKVLIKFEIPHLVSIMYAVCANMNLFIILFFLSQYLASWPVLRTHYFCELCARLAI